MVVTIEMIKPKLLSMTEASQSSPDFICFYHLYYLAVFLSFIIEDNYAYFQIIINICFWTGYAGKEYNRVDKIKGSVNYSKE